MIRCAAFNSLGKRWLSTAQKSLNWRVKCRKAGTYKNERVILGKQGMEIRVQGQSKPLLNFCANNYLGLSSNPETIQAAKDVLDSHGAGLSSVRFICGTQNIHRQLELKLAEFHGREDAILYAACFDANAGIFEVLMTDKDAILTDQLNHASIIDGIRLSKAKRLVYNHMDIEDLEAKLKESQNHRRRLIVTDGVFSMDGDIAPLKEIFELADKYKALVFLDECHSTGFMGKTGRGTEEALGLEPRAIINSTLGKALGGAMGGYTVGPKPVIDLLRQRSRPYFLAPAVVGSALKVLEMLSQKDNQFVSNLHDNVNQFRSKMTQLGFTVMGDKRHPICPVFLGDAALASKFADEMLNEGIYVIGFSYPVVPKGKARIRVQISAAHSTEQIDKCVNSFEKIGKKLKVI
ncbi:Aminotran-1-2 domain-containing protein [Aphelenchoides bicaudatus]|nr:Aminotran-1-2 domain-containing protein [Aphelenchoides bicaudatus]